MNLPNKLTLLRIILIPFFMLFAFPFPDSINAIVSEWSFYMKSKELIAFIIFIAASFTDFLDGHIARKQNLVTDFGKFLDPIADKLLVTASLLALTEVNKAYVWATMIILIREFAVTGIRLIAAGKGVVIAAGKMGKLKTVFQMAAISVLLFAPVIKINAVCDVLYTIGNVLMAAAVVLTIISGIEYLYKNRALIASK
ncbi:MAG: CDP-diacylglycerol--glycerol-3-phosphate 3-phosphatidyltransferase [Clostridia bacterium]|nr:CDP-diacylglycerol--glycerol-3-phosphate 3-phosphatidyltransferase [Clostridia bacterium]